MANHFRVYRRQSENRAWQETDHVFSFVAGDEQSKKNARGKAQETAQELKERDTKGFDYTVIQEINQGSYTCSKCLNS